MEDSVPGLADRHGDVRLHARSLPEVSSLRGEDWRRERTHTQSYADTIGCKLQLFVTILLQHFNQNIKKQTHFKFKINLRLSLNMNQFMVIPLCSLFPVFITITNNLIIDLCNMTSAL